MLQNAYFLAKIGADTAENEQHFAEILPRNGRRVAGPHYAMSRRASRSLKRRRVPAAVGPGAPALRGLRADLCLV